MITVAQMPEAPLEMGIIGLGRMGGGLALQAREKAIKVVGFTRRGVSEKLVHLVASMPPGSKSHIGQCASGRRWRNRRAVASRALNASLLRRVEHIGLVLSGGGARAAYQVGALRALAEIAGGSSSPFSIVVGLSAGAINSAAIGSGADDFTRTVQRLTETWMSLTPDAVYRTDAPRLAALGMRWLKDLATGGKLGRSRSNHLLDTAPLRELLRRKLDLTRVSQHVAAGLLRGLAVSATNYLTGTSVTFYDGVPELQPWVRYDRIAFREPLTIDHVMASAAIPVCFPPVSIDGKPFGDGGVRMTTPLSPAIHLGADKILAIGIRYVRTFEQTVAVNRDIRGEQVNAAQIGGVLLNALFLDALDKDVARLRRINRTLALVPEVARRKHPDLLRPIPALLLQPSQDLGLLAADEYHRFPAVLRHLLHGIGVTGQSGWDLLSYLAFQPEFVGKLIELGHADTIERRKEIEDFLAAPADVDPASLTGEPPRPARGPARRRQRDRRTH